VQKKKLGVGVNLLNGKNTKIRSVRATPLILAESAKYATPKGKRIKIDRLENGMFRPRFADGGKYLPLGTFTNFNDAEFAVVRYIQKKQRFKHQPGVYPEKYKGTSPWFN
jgi:hypothetical protein